MAPDVATIEMFDAYESHPQVKCGMARKRNPPQSLHRTVRSQSAQFRMKPRRRNAGARSL